MNLHGDPNLNEVIDAIDQTNDGWLPYAAVDGVNTLTTTNYTIADESLNRGFKLTGGTPTAAFSVVLPSVEAWAVVWNAESFTATVKTSAGTGVAIPAGQISIVFCDSTNVENLTPSFFATALNVGGNLIQNIADGVSATDAATVGQITAAIAAAVLGTTVGTGKVDALATEQYFIDMLLAGDGITITDNGDTLTFSRTASATVPIVANTTLVLHTLHNLIDTSGGALTALNLPDSGLVDAAAIKGRDAGGDFATNTCTLDFLTKQAKVTGPSGVQSGLVDTFICNVNGLQFEAVWDNSADIWLIKWWV